MAEFTPTVEEFQAHYPEFVLVLPPTDAAEKFQFTQVEFTASALNALSYVNVGAACQNPRSIAQMKAIFYAFLAHMLALRRMSDQGNPGLPVTSATEGSTSVGFATPPTGASNLRFWLQGTPYGIFVLAMLAKLAAGGAYGGGNPPWHGVRNGVGSTLH